MSGAILIQNPQIIPVNRQLPVSTEGINYPPVAFWPTFTKPPSVPLTNCTKIKGAWSIVNPQTLQTYQIVSDRRIEASYQESVESIERALKVNPEYGHSIRKFNFINGGLDGRTPGAKLKVEWVFPEIKYDIGHGDPVHPRIVLRTSYDSRWTFSVSFGAWRLICTNGMVVGKRVFYFAHKHTTHLDFNMIAEGLKNALHKFSDEVGLWRQWYDRLVTPVEYENVMSTMDFGKKREDEIGYEVEASSGAYLQDPDKYKTLTLWLFFNILSQYVTHRMKSEQQVALYEARMRDAFSPFYR